MPFSRTTGVALAMIGITAVTFGGTRPDDESPRTTVVYIVRHAEKTSDNPKADLSEIGRERAQMLAWMLRDVPLDAIYSTDVPRTINTVKPIAKAREMEVELYSPRPGELSGIIRNRHQGRTMLVCGHSDTIPQLLKELGVGIKEDLLEGYDDLFVVLLTSNASNTDSSTIFQRLHYGGKR